MGILVDLKEEEAVGNKDSRITITRAVNRMACQGLPPVFHANPWLLWELVPETSTVLEVVQELREGISRTNPRGLAMDRCDYSCRSGSVRFASVLIFIIHLFRTA